MRFFRRCNFVGNQDGFSSTTLSGKFDFPQTFVLGPWLTKPMAIGGLSKDDIERNA